MLGNKGVSIFMAIALLGLVGTTGWILMQQVDKRHLLIDLAREEVIKSEDMDGILDFGAYLVSNNFIACRSLKFSDTNRNCKWAGNHHSEVPAITGYTTPVNVDPSEMGLVQINLVDETELDGFDALSNLNDQLAYKITMEFGAAAGVESKTVIGYLVFGLQNPFGGEGDVQIARNYNYTEMVNQDFDVLTITGIIPIPREDDPTKYNRDFRTKRMQRPIAIPNITVETGICTESCSTGIMDSSEVNECRKPGSTDNAKGRVTFHVTNLGPGILYNLELYRKVIYDPTLFGNTTTETIPPPLEGKFSVFEEAITDGEVILQKGYLLPSQSFTIVDDNFDCSSIMSLLEEINTANILAGDLAGMGTFSTNTNDQSTTQYENVGIVKYALELSPFALSHVQPDSSIIPFLGTFDPKTNTMTPGVYNPYDFQPPDNIVSANSIIEPARISEPKLKFENGTPKLQVQGTTFTEARMITIH